MKPILECHELTKKYGNFSALTALNLSLPKGQIIGLLGPNGSGKTTLIKLINGLLAPTAGTVFINGFKPGIETKKIISYLPDHDTLSSYLRVKEVLTYYSDFYQNFNREKAEDMLKTLNINTNSRISSLSKGTREKMQLALVMSRTAELYVLDEPIGGVDPAARDYILRTILTNYNENSTVLISTHLISEIENVLDRILFLRNGILTLDKSVDEIRTDYGKSVDDLFREVFKC